VFTLLNEKLKLFLSISYSIYFFILFFQTFPIESFDFNNKLLLVSGLAGILFLVLIFVRLVFPVYLYMELISEKYSEISVKKLKKEFYGKSKYTIFSAK